MSRLETPIGGRTLSAPLLLAGLSALLVAACVEEGAPGRDPNALTGFAIELVDTQALGESPFEFPSTFTPVTIAVEALRADGTRKSDYEGTVQVRVVPGEVSDATRFLRLSGGINEAQEIEIRFAFGEARIWVEEVGIDQSNECRDGFDNDRNGLLDYPGDPGCFAPEDPSEGTASYVTGITDPILFRAISVRNVQYNPDDEAGESPLLGEEVIVIGRGELIVTNVTFNGFYITDAQETEGYDSIFLFNFNFPDGVRIGDKMRWVSGGVAEFQSATQLTFPDWEHDPSYPIRDEDRAQMSLCETPDNPDISVVEPALLTPADLADYAVLESRESAVVRVEDVDLTTRFIDCDFDESGRINGQDEEACRSVCQNDNLCTELSNYEERDQFNGEAGGASVQISGAQQVAGFDLFSTCERVPDDPQADAPTFECPARQLASVTGNLRHVYLTSRIQLWEIIPRYTCDLVFSCDVNADCPLPDQTCQDNTCQ